MQNPIFRIETLRHSHTEYSNTGTCAQGHIPSTPIVLLVAVYSLIVTRYIADETNSYIVGLRALLWREQTW